MQPVLLLSLSTILGIALSFLGVPWLLGIILAVLLGLVLFRISPRLALAACIMVVVGAARGCLLIPAQVAPGPTATIVQAVSTPIVTASGYNRGLVRDVSSGITYHMYWSEPWPMGLRMEVQGEVVLPTPPLNPGELDYAAYLERQGVEGLLFVRTIQPLAKYRVSWLEGVRGVFRANLNKLPDGPRGLALAVMLGDRSALSSAEQDNWRKAGASHILAVSGLHIGIAAGAVYALSRRFTGFRTSWLIASLTALSYASLVGSSASAWRAALAFVLLAIAKVTLREAKPLNILALVAALMLLQNPRALSDPGFLLSFGATAGLIWLAPSIQAGLLGPPKLRSLLSATLAAQAATLPIVVSFFGAWPVYGVVANLLLVPVSTVLVSSALITGLLGGIPGVGTVVYYVFTGTAWFFSSAVHLLSSLPAASINLVAMPLVLIILFYVFLLCFPTMSRSHPRLAGLLMLTLMLVGALLPSLVHTRDVTLTFLSIGNADACHIRIGSQHYLVDTGTKEAAERIITPYLRSQGVNALQGVFISHGHEDHAGGLNVLKSSFRVSQVIVGPGLEELDHGFIPLGDGMRLDIGATIFSTWQASGNLLDLNNQSVVLLLQHGEFSALFPGDIGQAAEHALISRLIPVDVLKVAHHGSASSSTPQWLNALRPSLAVISVGANSYGHPSQQVLASLGNIKSQTLRTDEAGAVRVRVKDNRFEVHSYKQGRWQHVGTYSLPAVRAGYKGTKIPPHLPVVRGGGVVCASSYAVA